MKRVRADETWSLFDPKTVPRAARPVRRRLRARPTKRRKRQAWPSQRQGPRAVRPHDAHAGPNRQRLDDIQGSVQSRAATRRRAGKTSFTFRTCALKFWRSPPARRDGGVQSRFDQPGAATCVTRMTTASVAFDFEKLASNVRLAVRQLDRGDRSQLLSHRGGGHAESAMAAGGPRGDGLAGRVLRSCGCPSTRRGAGAVDAHQEEIYFTALVASSDLRPGTGRHTQPLPKPGPRAASCSRTLGASTPHRNGALGGPAATHRAKRVCATRCWWPSRPRRPSPPSLAATNASSRRSRTCSSVKPCPATSCRSTDTWSTI